MKFRKGLNKDLKEIMDIIKRSIINMEDQGIFQWDELYPNEDILSTDISQEELYVFIEEEIIMGFITLNHNKDMEYEEINWSHSDGNPLIIHRLCIDPKYGGKGRAKALIEFAENYGKEHGYESIRLDAYSKNLRACKLYENLGYTNCGTVEFRKGTFNCYEKPLL